MIIDTNWAYAAGLFDGEGTVSLCQRGDGQIISITSIGMTHQETIMWLCEMFGGSLLEDRGASAGKFPKRRRLWRWQRNGRNALPFLRGVFPFLKTKKDIVEVVISFLELPLHSQDAGVRLHRLRCVEIVRQLRLTETIQ